MGRVAWQFALSGRAATPVGQVILGRVTSILFTKNEQVAVLPFPSLAVKVTVLLPTPDTEVPDTGDCVTVGEAAQLSTTVAPLM